MKTSREAVSSAEVTFVVDAMAVGDENGCGGVCLKRIVSISGRLQAML